MQNTMFIQDSNKMNSFYARQMYKLQGADFSQHVRPEGRSLEFIHLARAERINLVGILYKHGVLHALSANLVPFRQKP